MKRREEARNALRMIAGCVPRAGSHFASSITASAPRRSWPSVAVAALPRVIAQPSRGGAGGGDDDSSSHRVRSCGARVAQVPSSASSRGCSLKHCRSATAIDEEIGDLRRASPIHPLRWMIRHDTRAARSSRRSILGAGFQTPRLRRPESAALAVVRLGDSADALHQVEAHFIQ